MHSTRYTDTRETHEEVDATVVCNYFTIWEYGLLFKCLTLNYIRQPWTERVLNGEIHRKPRKRLDKSLRTFPAKLWDHCLEVPGSPSPRNRPFRSYSLSTLKRRLHSPAIPHKGSVISAALNTMQEPVISHVKMRTRLPKFRVRAKAGVKIQLS